MTRPAVCSQCKTEFVPHFRYQVEPVAGRQGSFQYYCSQRCLAESHKFRADGASDCNACGRRFQVELVSHVLFIAGKRFYACTGPCRAEIQKREGSRRREQLLDPRAFCVPDAQAPSTNAPVRPVMPPAPESSRLGPGGRLSRARVISVFNHKGGTGKTTSSVQIAAGLAMKGRRVALIDADGQGNVGASLGIRSSRSLYHVVVMKLAASEALVSARPNLDVVLANETLAAAELFLAGRQNRHRVMEQAFAPLLQKLDYVIIDCSPSLSLVNQNALVMSDSVLCPVSCDFLALFGVNQVLRTVRSIQQHLSHPLGLFGVLPTHYDARARICQEALATLRSHFKERCLEPIRFATKVKEAPAQGCTIFEYAPDSKATTDYSKVVDRFIDTEQEDQLGPIELGGVA